MSWITPNRKNTKGWYLVTRDITAKLLLITLLSIFMTWLLVGFARDIGVVYVIALVGLFGFMEALRVSATTSRINRKAAANPVALGMIIDPPDGSDAIPKALWPMLKFHRLLMMLLHALLAAVLLTIAIAILMPLSLKDKALLATLITPVSLALLFIWFTVSANTFRTNIAVGVLTVASLLTILYEFLA